MKAINARQQKTCGSFTWKRRARFHYTRVRGRKAARAA
jgi:hypothetical protein